MINILIAGFGVEVFAEMLEGGSEAEVSLTDAGTAIPGTRAIVLLRKRTSGPIGC